MMAVPTGRWLAPAKLNLFLHITGRRSDGYHELQTLFQLLDYGDELSFAADDSGALTLHVDGASPIQGCPTADNLVLQAARLLRTRVRQPQPGARIRLLKRLPIGGGLGGGSSDAAITLLALNRLWQLHLDNATLQSIGRQLGADVPVFVGGRSAWAEGVGDRLQAVELPEKWYLVVTPGVSVSTAAVFARQNLTGNSPAIKMADFLAGSVRNDCESTTRKLYPAVDQALHWLGGFAAASMTGTGASVFASFADRTSAEAVWRQLPPAMTGFVARGINVLPLPDG